MRRLLSAAVACATLAGTTVTTPTPLRAQPVTVNFSEYACTDPSQPCEYQATTGRPLTSRGFDFYDRSSITPGGPANSLGTWSNSPSNLGYANRPSNLDGATAIFAPINGDFVEMFSHSEQNFDLYAMDVAGLFRQSFNSPPVPEPTTFYMLFEYYRSPTSYFTQRPDGAFYAGVDPAPLVDGDRVPLLRTVDFAQPQDTTLGGVLLEWGYGSPADFRGSGIYGIRWAQASYTGVGEFGGFTYDLSSGLNHQFTNVVASVVPEPGTFALAAGGLVVLVGVRRRPYRITRLTHGAEPLS